MGKEIFKQNFHVLYPVSILRPRLNLLLISVRKQIDASHVPVVAARRQLDGDVLGLLSGCCSVAAETTPHNFHVCSKTLATTCTFPFKYYLR